MPNNNSSEKKENTEASSGDKTLKTREEASASSPAEKKKEDVQPPPATPTGKKREFSLSGIYAFKLAMSGLYNDKGRFEAVTFLQYRPWVVSQVKDMGGPQSSKGSVKSYKVFQLCSGPQKPGRVSRALKTHLAASGFKEGARWVREIKANPAFDSEVDGVKVGDSQSIHSVKKGDVVSVTSTSKGKGFAGVVKRWNFRGGPASHGAKTHRTTGSIGNRTEPARVMPGKKMPGPSWVFKGEYKKC